MFWTDSQQAGERLNGTFILYGESPAFIEAVSSARNPVASARIYPTGQLQSLDLEDPRFHDFRVLPATGWVNNYENGEAMFIERRPVRSRSHGLNHSNTRVGYLPAERQHVLFGDYNYDTVARDRGYAEACSNTFPVLREVLDACRPDSSIAISKKFAITRDNLGVRWLYRMTERVGMFPNADTVMLAAKYKYLKEELETSSEISVANIQEF